MARVVSDARELLTLTELTDVLTYELRGRRISDGTPSAPDPEIAVRVTESKIETRMRLEVTTTDASIFADMSAVYSLSESVVIPPGVISEFIERAGIMAVYPFVREAVFATAARLGVPPPVLALVRAGSLIVANMRGLASTDLQSTPAQLARELGTSPKSIRQWLRQSGHAVNASGRWHLDAATADAVRRQFVKD